MAPLHAGILEPRLSAFLHHFAIILRNRAEHRHYHAAGRYCVIDVFGQREEPCARRANSLQDQRKVLERARQTVEFPDDEHIACREPAEQMGQFRTVPAAAGGVFLIDVPAAPCRQRSGLRREILALGPGDPSVADQDWICCVIRLLFRFIW